MTYDKFLKLLDTLYCEKEFPVKFYLQKSTFSYEVHTQETAFLGKPIFESEIYFHDRDSLERIIEDIKAKRKELKNNPIKPSSNVNKEIEL